MRGACCCVRSLSPPLRSVQPAVTSRRMAARLSATATPDPTPSVWRVGEHGGTEVLQIPSTAGPPALQLLVVPGNPGQAGFYLPFMRALHRVMEGRAAVTTISNLGIDGRGLTPAGRTYSLEEQVQHKVDVLREKVLLPGGPPVVLLGHSIGGYMCIHATHRLEHDRWEAGSRAAVSALDAVAGREVRQPDAAVGSLEAMQAELQAELQREGQAASLPAGQPQDSQQQQQQEEEEQQQGAANGASDPPAGATAEPRIAKVVALMPFFTVDPDCGAQGRLKRLTPLYRPIAWAARVLRLLPGPAKRGLVRIFSPGMEPHAVETAAGMVNATSVANGFYMGMTEFEALAAPADWWLLRQLGSRVAVVVAPGDVWFKRWKWDAMHTEVPGVEAYWEEGLTHAFCVSTEQSERLAELVAPLLQRVLEQQQQQLLQGGAAAAPLSSAL